MPSGPHPIFSFVCPADILFTQDTISDRFSDGRPIQTLVKGLIEAQQAGRDPNTPFATTNSWIDVVKENGKLWTLSNRRLWCLQTAGIEKVAAWVYEDTSRVRCELRLKWTTKNNGRAPVVIPYDVTVKKIASKGGAEAQSASVSSTSRTSTPDTSKTSLVEDTAQSVMLHSSAVVDATTTVEGQILDFMRTQPQQRCLLTHLRCYIGKSGLLDKIPDGKTFSSVVRKGGIVVTPNGTNKDMWMVSLAPTSLASTSDKSPPSVISGVESTEPLSAKIVEMIRNCEGRKCKLTDVGVYLKNAGLSASVPGKLKEFVAGIPLVQLVQSGPNTDIVRLRSAYSTVAACTWHGNTISSSDGILASAPEPEALSSCTKEQAATDTSRRDTTYSMFSSSCEPSISSSVVPSGNGVEDATATVGGRILDFVRTQPQQRCSWMELASYISVSGLRDEIPDKKLRPFVQRIGGILVTPSDAKSTWVVSLVATSGGASSKQSSPAASPAAAPAFHSAPSSISSATSKATTPVDDATCTRKQDLAARSSVTSSGVELSTVNCVSSSASTSCSTHPLPGESTRDFQKRMTRLKYKPGQIEKFLHAYEERLEKKGEEVGRLGKKQTSADRGEEEKPSDEKLMAVASSLVWQ